MGVQVPPSAPYKSLSVPEGDFVLPVEGSQLDFAIAGARALKGQFSRYFKTRCVDDPEATEVLGGREERCVGDNVGAGSIVDHACRTRWLHSVCIDPMPVGSQHVVECVDGCHLVVVGGLRQVVNY